ncbi:glycoside hydrolase family 3 N-terminal domain-containing protein [Halomontanus rarus]|uniref:glycoside hydrolase family 3 N-terminal domain-containing protein n=1 Tax=Halomontanus rarus TaxID=3034020 RepID=UPI001A99D877
MTVRERSPEGEQTTRAAELIEELTLAEKVGQLVGTYIGSMDRDISIEEAKELVVDSHVGTVAAFGIGVSLYHDAERVTELANELQETALEETRHGIPLLLPVDAVHGHAYVNQATVFPHGLGMAATRRDEFAETGGEITAAEMRATGANLNYGPTCDVARDPRWGRTFETYGESPLLCGSFASAAIRGLESSTDGPRVAATAKHFPAYSEPEAGEDAAVVDRSTSTIHQLFVPPFEKAIDAGASVVMPCYNSIDGEPAHGSTRYLTELLRERLGFDGAVLSDWGGIDMLHEDHRVTASQRDSGRQAIQAGLDQISIGREEYADHLVSLVEDGELSEERIDEAALRILELKESLGLFEDPFVDVETVTEEIGTPEHRNVAREVARESQTLLQNEDDLLPLSRDLDSILVTGPNADSLRHQYGGWSVQHPERDSGVTVKDGIESAVGDETTVRYEQGATMTETIDLGAVEEAATESDVAVVTVGENWYFHEFGPQDVAGETGTYPTRSKLSLSDAQQELLETVHATGTPVVLAVITGRPLAVDWAAENVPAILYSYYPGSEGGRAIADVLFGDHNPSGRLPISIPRSEGDLPTRFNHYAHPTPIGDDEHPDTYDPLFAFGDGESYTEFVCEELEVSASTIGPAESVEATITVENVGDRTGAHALDFFLTDRVSSRVRPVREHVAFTKVELEPGESTTVTATIPNEAMAVTDSRGRTTVESGEFELTCEGESTTFAVR